MVEFFARDTDYIEKLNELAAGGGGGSAALTATQIGVGSGANVLSGSSELTYSAGVFQIVHDANASTVLTIYNNDTGALATAYMQAGSGSALTKWGRTGPTFVTNGLRVADQAVLENTANSTLFHNDGAHDFIFAADGYQTTDERFRIYAAKAVGIRSSGADFNLKIASTEALTADRQLSIALNDGARTLSLAGNLTTSGANALTLTTTGATNVTLPTSGTLLAQQTTQTLTDAATVAWDTALGPVAKVTLAGNRTLGAPTNLVDGGTYILRVIQDGTGTRTLAYNAVFKWPAGTAPVLTTTASAIDILTFVSDGSNLYGVAQKGFA